MEQMEYLTLSLMKRPQDIIWHWLQEMEYLTLALRKRPQDIIWHWLCKRWSTWHFHLGSAHKILSDTDSARDGADEVPDTNT
jgi:hypothetical protein